MTYSFELVSPSVGDLPDFIRTTDERELSIKSEDIDDLDVYMIRLVGTVENSPDLAVPIVLEDRT